MKAFKEKRDPWVLPMGTSFVIDAKFAIELAARGLKLALFTPSKDRLEALAKKIAIQLIAGKFRQPRRLYIFSLGRYLSASLKLNYRQVK
jgi:hypothetical protein